MFAVAAQALRSWNGARSIALFAILAFALGIGSTTAIFTVVNSVLLEPLPYHDGDRFVALFGGDLTNPKTRTSTSIPDFLEYERRTTSFDAFGWFRLASFNLTSPGAPQYVAGAALTPSLAHNLGVRPIVGQWFTDETGAVLSYTLWQRLGGKPNIVGSGLTLNGRQLTVTGVMPARFRFPVRTPGITGGESEVWVYLDPTGRGEDEQFAAHFGYARRKAGLSLAQAEQDVQRAAAEIAKTRAASDPNYTARLEDLHASATQTIRPTLLLLLAAAGLLLLITCANVSTLLLARWVARARETAIRVALGASQSRLALFYFTEASIVSLAGAAAGALLSVALVRLVAATAAEYIPQPDEIRFDWKVLLFSLGAAFVASLLSSLAPLGQAMRTMPNDALNAGVRSSAGARARRVSQSLVVAEIALAFTLLAVSAVLIVHLRSLSRIALGFDPNNLLTFELTLPDAIIRSPQRSVFQGRLVEALEAIPGVSGAATASQVPVGSCCSGGDVHPEGVTHDPRQEQRNRFTFVSYGYFRTLGVPLINGRFLIEGDARDGTLLNLVANQTAATRFWPGRHAIGAFGRLNGPDGTRFRIVGVSGDVRNNHLSRGTAPEFFLPTEIVPVNPLQFIVRSTLPLERLVPEVQRAVRRVDPGLPVHNPASMQSVVRDSLLLERTGSLMMTLFASVALLLATLGIFGMVSYSVRQRTVEIGTRMALGATGSDVLRLVVGGGLRTTAIGLGLGAIAVIAATWLVARFFTIRDIGVLPFVSATVIVGAVTVMASLIPAWRATLLSPLVAIRNEPRATWAAARENLLRSVGGVFRRASFAVRESSVPTGTLLTEFVAAARGADSHPEALRGALNTLCTRLGFTSAFLFEKDSATTYRCIALAGAADTSRPTLPANGFLINRLKHFPYPLRLSAGELDTILMWASEHAPHHEPEILALKESGIEMAIALRTKHEILGLLLTTDRIDRSEHDEAERQLLQNCAEHFALMIENARLTARVVEQEKVRRDIALAAEVQRRLLPERPPEATIASLAAVSLPARSVGGDYYDFIDVGDQQIGIALADVSGKGIAAALIMSVVQASLRIIASEEGEVSLPRIAEKMNRFLHRSTAANSYATFFYAQVDERTRQLRYVNAGHNPPYLLRRVGHASDIHELSTGGAVIGLFPQMSYSEATIDLQSADVLVAFTDGVTEALNTADEEFGEERLKALLGQIMHLPVNEIASRLADELRSWIKDAAQHDDLTFVVMKVN
jgi:predicted permease